MLSTKYLFLFSFIAQLYLTKSARILAVNCWPAVSHEKVLNSIWKELSLRGHQVTAITTRPYNEPSLVNLTEIDISYAYDIARKPALANKLVGSVTTFHRMELMMGLMEEIVEKSFKLKEVTELLKNGKFDLVLVEPHHPLVFAFGSKLKVPIIAVSSLGVFLEIHDSQGNPTHPILTPDLFVEMHIDKGFQTFLDKVTSFLYNFWYRAYYRWHILPRADRIARTYLGEDLPYLGDVIDNNITLVIVNWNPITSPVRPNVPSIVEIAQVFIDDTPLPGDYKEYLDKSKNGVIYFSLGTLVTPSMLNSGLIQTVKEALGELPFDVLWKYDKDELPGPGGKPANVAIKKWMPQQAILNHPNVKAFVTQGGMQSVEEAIFAAVPLVGIPFVCDQSTIINKMAKWGMAESLDHTTLTKESLKNAIMKVATDPKYKSNALKVKYLMEDHPIKGMDKTIWWIDYVLRHGGADHLKGAAVHVSWIEYFMLDVIAFLVAIVFVFIFSILKVFKLLNQYLNAKKLKKE